MPKGILFLDLDGTVRLGKKELGRFVNGPGDVDVFPGVVDIIRSYKALGWKVVGISNQGGIALGHVTENEVNRAIMETNRQCAHLFDGILFCPHHPEAEKEEDASCLCRKPMIGNVVRAFINLSTSGFIVPPSRCLFVGDMDVDKQCAENAGIPFMSAERWRKLGPIGE